MDKIILNNLQFYGFHGVFPEENKLGQRFHVNLQLHLPLEKAGKSDDVKDSIDYGHVFEVVKEIVEGEPFDLIEALAEKIASDLFHTFELLQACTVTVIKPDPPIPGTYESVGVEIYRERTNE